MDKNDSIKRERLHMQPQSMIGEQSPPTLPLLTSQYNMTSYLDVPKDF